MAEFLMLMHGDAPTPEEPAAWAPYLSLLNAAGVLRGGSAIGTGLCFRRVGATPEISRHLAGYVKLEAPSLEDAQRLLAGNPTYEAGGTVEIRELPRT